MSFIQVVEFDTTREEELQRLLDEWRDAVGSETTVMHSRLARDHTKPGHYVAIVEFPSYEEAMRNSELPQTDEMSRRVQALCQSPPRFLDLDVIREEDF